MRRLLVLLGMAAIGYGGWRLVNLLASTTSRRSWATFFLGSLVGHDFLLAPLVVLVGVLLARVLPPLVKAPVQAGLILTAVLVLVEWPFVRRYGIRPDTPSALPRNYAHGLLLVLALVWAVIAGWVIMRLIRDRARDPRGRRGWHGTTGSSTTGSDSSCTGAPTPPPPDTSGSRAASS
ncbi:MAG: hypothetical protein ACJ73S_19480 [Mycobacteriales bacterium]